jgi:hypothetical protein
MFVFVYKCLKKTAFFYSPGVLRGVERLQETALFQYKDDLFTKTGSGQT